MPLCQGVQCDNTRKNRKRRNIRSVENLSFVKKAAGRKLRDECAHHKLQRGDDGERQRTCEQRDGIEEVDQLGRSQRRDRQSRKDIILESSVEGTILRPAKAGMAISNNSVRMAKKRLGM